MKKFILLLMAFCLCQVASADDNPVIPVIIKKGKGDPVPTQRPRVPSRQSVECYYDGESLYLSFAYSEGECILTVTDNATLAEDDYAFDSSVPATINIGYVSDASLTITTSLGQTYTGEIE